jgi:hypothetical protein
MKRELLISVMVLYSCVMLEFQYQKHLLWYNSPLTETLSDNQ